MNNVANENELTKNIKIIKYYDELYNLYCIEISKFINKEKDITLENKLKIL